MQTFKILTKRKIRNLYRYLTVLIIRTFLIHTQDSHSYMIRIFAHNEIGSSEPLESEEPVTIETRRSPSRPRDEHQDDEDERTLPSLSMTETTTSWMRDANMDADIRFYARGATLKKSEYFFRIWYYAKELFK